MGVEDIVSIDRMSRDNVDGCADAAQKRPEAILKYLNAEVPRMPAEKVRAPILPFKSLDGISQTFRHLSIEEESSDIFHDRLERAAGPISNRRPASSRYFQRGHPEVL